MVETEDLCWWFLYHLSSLFCHFNIIMDWWYTSSQNRLLDIISKPLYWPGMTKDCSNCVAACVTCQMIKTNQPVSSGLLQPIVVQQTFELVSLDIKGPLKKSSDGFKYILVCCDHFTSWVEAAPIKTITANEAINQFFHLIISGTAVQKNLFPTKGRSSLRQCLRRYVRHSI